MILWKQNISSDRKNVKMAVTTYWNLMMETGHPSCEDDLRYCITPTFTQVHPHHLESTLPTSPPISTFRAYSQLMKVEGKERKVKTFEEKDISRKMVAFASTFSFVWMGLFPPSLLLYFRFTLSTSLQLHPCPPSTSTLVPHLYPSLVEVEVAGIRTSVSRLWIKQKQFWLEIGDGACRAYFQGKLLSLGVNKWG